MTPQLLESAARTHWKEQELDNLRQWTAEGVSREEQANRLGRSEDAVGAKLRELKLVPKAGTWWRDDEIATLKDRVANKVKVREIALELQRSPRSVRVKIEQLKLLPPRPIWSPDEEAKVRQWEAQKMPVEKQAELLGRPPGAVLDKIRRLGLRPMRVWTKAEDDKLRELHPKGLSNREKGKILKRTEHGVKKRVQDLGLGRAPVKPWTDEEVANLRKWIKEGELRKVIARRLDRCESVVKDKIAELKLARPVDAKKWTPEEEQKLRLLKAENLTIQQMADRIGRTRQKVRGKLARMGLVKKRQKGWTAKDLKLVEQWLDEGVPGHEQARRLGRTYPAWSNAVKRFKLRETPFSHYNPELRLAVIAGIEAGLNQTGIAARLGKSLTSVGSIVRELEEKGLVKRLGRKGPYQMTALWKGGGKDE